MEPDDDRDVIEAFLDSKLLEKANDGSLDGTSESSISVSITRSFMMNDLG